MNDVYEHTHDSSPRNTNADAHLYRVARKRCGSRRESHSINTPRCLLRLHPQERRSTPVSSLPPLAYQPASPLSLPLSLSLSRPLVPSARCAPLASHSLKKERRRKRKRFFSLSLSLSPQRKYSAAQQDFSTQGNNKYIYIHLQILTRNSRDTRERFEEEVSTSIIYSFIRMELTLEYFSFSLEGRG